MPASVQEIGIAQLADALTAGAIGWTHIWGPNFGPKRLDIRPNKAGYNVTSLRPNPLQQNTFRDWL
jgi:hypothetical protein